MIYAFAGTAVVGLVACIALAWRAISAGRRAEAAIAERGVVAGQAKDSALKLEAEQIAHKQVAEQLLRLAGEYTDTKQRYEARLAELREGIRTLEVDLEACTTPGARAARLERLLSTASPGGAGRPTDLAADGDRRSFDPVPD